MKIIDGGLEDPRVQALLAHHFHTARAATAPGSAHALDFAGLNHQTFIFGPRGREIRLSGSLL